MVQRVNECIKCHKVKPWKEFWAGKQKVLRKTCKKCRYDAKRLAQKRKKTGQSRYRPKHPVTVRQMTAEERQRAFG